MKAYLDALMKLPISKQQIGKNNIAEVIARVNDITVKIKAFNNNNEMTSDRLESAKIEFINNGHTYEYDLLDLVQKLPDL